jgi:platelet-activating factor acetylhydrolase
MSRFRLPPTLRPRLTPRYVLSSVAAIYVVYCWLWGMPLFSSSLPAYTGPHSVGVVDIESPCDGRKTSDVKFKSTGQTAFLVCMTLRQLTDPADFLTARNGVVLCVLPGREGRQIRQA